VTTTRTSVFGTLAGVVLLASLEFAGCGASPTTLAPSGMPTAVPSVPSGVRSIGGFVLDTGFRPLAGARIEVLDGPQAGAIASADSAGQFSVSGAFDTTTRFRASKDGYIGATQTWSCSVGICPGVANAQPWLGFYLAVVAPPVNIAGTYTLTFVVDRACADFPNELRVRNYNATIALAPAANTPADTRLELTVAGGAFLAYGSGDTYDSFPIGVAGDYASFFLYGRHNPAIAERLAVNTYIAFSGNAEASLATPAASSITAPFDGWIEYCVMGSAMSNGYHCGPPDRIGDPISGAVITRTTCDSPHHQLVLTRR
jgi:hypothetical protein